MGILKQKIGRGKPPFKLDKFIILPTGETKMPYMKSVCKAGCTRMIRRYYTRSAQPKKKRSPKKNETTDAQKKVNDRQLERKLTALLNANFNGECWYITFDYDPKKRPQTIAELKNHENKLLRELRKVYKKQGLILKYIWTAEVGPRGGAHIHMVVSPIDARLLRDVWPHGWTTIKPMDKSGQYSRLASYFIKYYQKTRGTDAAIQSRSYCPSKNLTRPVFEKKRMKGNCFGLEVKVPKGWYLDKQAFGDSGIQYGITDDGYEYMYYILVKETIP